MTLHYLESRLMSSVFRSVTGNLSLRGPRFKVIWCNWTYLSYVVINFRRTLYTLAKPNSMYICARFFLIPR